MIHAIQDFDIPSSNKVDEGLAPPPLSLAYIYPNISAPFSQH